MADSRDILGKNRKFTGTTGIKLPTGTQAQRVNEAGQLRFNSDTNLAEYYDGTDWKSIDAPPTITGFTLDGGSSVTSATIDNEASGDATIVISGSNFDTTSAVVVFEPESAGSDVSVQTITRTNSSQFTVTVTRTDLIQANSPYAIKLTNGSGLAATLASALVCDNTAPVFDQAAGTLATISDGDTLTTEVDCSATDDDGDTITYSITSGSLPGTGLSLNSSTGFVTGTYSTDSAYGVTSFTVTATDSAGNAASREFGINEVDPNYAADFLVVAGGGGNRVVQGGNREGGSGAGGLRTSYGPTSGGGSSAQSSLTLQGGSVYTATVGVGASSRANGGASSLSGPGISTVSTSGGGYGGSCDSCPGNPGGSGGGGWYNNGGGSGTGGEGYSGSPGFSGPPYGGAGGGAAGSGGRDTAVGAGLSVSITGSGVTYATGGVSNNYPSTVRNTNGPANSGNGAGGVANGGSGIVVLRVPTDRYTGTTTGSPTVTTSGSDTILTYTGSGSYTA